MKINAFKLPLLAMLVLPFLGCEKDDDNGPDNEQELITKVTLTFTGGGAALPFSLEDKDGDGGLAPTIDEIKLKPNTDYTLAVTFLHTLHTPAEDLTTEVRNESADHLVCFTTSGAMTSPAIQDKDANGKDLGLSSTLKTGAVGNGTLKIVLKHKPDKSNANACSTGETDVEATFTVKVQ